ncbi:LOB domain-containing protein 23 [Euphorbia peplus]|nr:LOB domain-containing protein 23 [Euphorbia peplus]
MISGRCAACKSLRRRCSSDCILAPYFPPNNPQRFATVHKIYGASNIGKLLQELPREEAAESLHYEAQCENPVYGCVRMITQLHQQIEDVENELAKTQAQIALLSRMHTQ